MKLPNFWVAVLGAGISVPALAGTVTFPPNVVPEPETLALLAVAGVVGYIVKRRRK